MIGCRVLGVVHTAVQIVRDVVVSRIDPGRIQHERRGIVVRYLRELVLEILVCIPSAELPAFLCRILQVVCCQSFTIDIGCRVAFRVRTAVQRVLDWIGFSFPLSG